ncbi:CRISPR-associated endonuclease Cas1 [Klebsiella pneumoniae]
MNIEFLRRGTLDATGAGLIHINTVIRPVITRPGDIVIAERGCTLGGRAVSWAYRNRVTIFITSNGATKLYGWVSVNQSSQELAKQIVASANERVKTDVACWMVHRRFGITCRPIDGLRSAVGVEGAQVRKIYAELARDQELTWTGRESGKKWQEISPLNRTISMCNSALYNLTELAIIYTGYSPNHGFIHGARSGKPLVYDLADMVKFEHITPIAFRIAADGRPNPEWRARAVCARLFQRRKLLRELISLTQETMDVAFESYSIKPSRRRR